MKATLKIDNIIYDEFFMQPFKSHAEGSKYEVKFDKTDDLLFYDKIDRMQPKITLQDELDHEEAVSAAALERPRATACGRARVWPVLGRWATPGRPDSCAD